MSNNEPDYKDNLVFDTKKSKNKDFVVGDYDFIKPEFVTTKEECYRLISLAYSAASDLEQYRIALVHRIAQLTKQKVFRQKTEYDFTECYDYFVAKDKDSIEDTSGISDEIISIDEGYPGTIELIKDYSNE